jgi:quercetin dioxygenase-like cupin family protein
MTTQPARRIMPGYMSMQPAGSKLASAALVLPRGAGREINAGGRPALVKLEHEDCGGALMLQEQEFGPGESTRAHRHGDAAQFAVVTEGELWYGIGGEVHKVSQGGFVLRPAGVDHIVFNAGNKPARQFEGHLPGALLGEFFARYGALASAMQLTEPGAAEKLAAAFETYYNDEMTAAIEAAYGVSAGGGPQR